MSPWDIAAGAAQAVTQWFADRTSSDSACRGAREAYRESDEARKLQALDDKMKELESSTQSSKSKRKDSE